MVTLVLIDIANKHRPKYKKYPYKAMEKGKDDAFSRVLMDVIYTEDIRKYIHSIICKLHHMKFEKLRDTLLDDTGYLAEYQNIATKKLDIWKYYPNFSDTREWVRIILSRIHDKFIYLDKPFRIMKDAIRVVIGLSSTRLMPTIDLKLYILFHTERNRYTH